jgi:hypothetical protein
MPLVGIHFPQHSELVQPLEGVLQIARPQISNHGLVRVSLLPPDLRQFSRLQIGVLFQKPERIATFNGTVLGSITGKDNPAVLLLGQISHPRQCANAQKPGLINPYHLPANLRL